MLFPKNRFENEGARKKFEGLILITGNKIGTPDGRHRWISLIEAAC